MSSGIDLVFVTVFETAFKICFRFSFCKISGNLFYVAVIKMLLLLGIDRRHI